MGVCDIDCCTSQDLVAVTLVKGCALLFASRLPFLQTTGLGARSISLTFVDDTHTHTYASPTLTSTNTTSTNTTARRAAGPIGMMLRLRGVVMMRLNRHRRLIAIGTTEGIVELVCLRVLTPETAVTPLCRLDTRDFGSSMTKEVSMCVHGGVTSIEWSGDGRAVAVGYKYARPAVFSHLGVTLVAPFSRTRSGECESSHFGRDDGQSHEESVSALTWAAMGCHLLYSSGTHTHVYNDRTTHDTDPPPPLTTLSKSVRGVPLMTEVHLFRTVSWGPLQGPYNSHGGGAFFSQDSDSRVLLGADRILIVEVMPSSPLSPVLSHIPLPPPHYTKPNWPIRTCSLSPGGQWMIMAGVRGMMIYSLRSRRWSSMGNIRDEQSLVAEGVGWVALDVCFICSGDDIPKPHTLTHTHTHTQNNNTGLTTTNVSAYPLPDVFTQPHASRIITSQNIETDNIDDRYSGRKHTHTHTQVSSSYSIYFFFCTNRLDLDGCAAKIGNLKVLPLKALVLSRLDRSVSVVSAGSDELSSSEVSFHGCQYVSASIKKAKKRKK
eukprot:GHVR01170478.1.p1 GENE.GHVR01170478.1~~GHVR01170478.1.p1  ORF type:complete len:548 (-),score=191.49 GHVR01170478.1:84-1727(-)